MSSILRVSFGLRNCTGRIYILFHMAALERCFNARTLPGSPKKLITPTSKSPGQTHPPDPEESSFWIWSRLLTIIIPKVQPIHLFLKCASTIVLILVKGFIQSLPGERQCPSTFLPSPTWPRPPSSLYPTAHHFHPLSSPQ